MQSIPFALAARSIPRRPRRVARVSASADPQTPPGSTEQLASQSTSVDPVRPQTAGWTVLGIQLWERGGVATVDDLVLELFGVRPDDPDFAARRKLAYALPGRSPVRLCKPLWDRRALALAMMNGTSPSADLSVQAIADETAAAPRPRLVEVN
ncbi:MAG: hypothetical protein K2R93_14850 [Gemmatimonadaceae bacterium]|nr:hypothetical protein [Gemmatimonadaceae bacterium]